jgi:hypothetical protein
MKILVVLSLCAFGSFPFASCAQQTSPALPDAPDPSAHRTVSPVYTPPTPTERFRTYFRQTYSIPSLLEAGVHAGINQARDNPSEWPEGAEGYGDRFGSAAGEIIVRGTTEYALSAAFKEDLRIRLCRGCDLGNRAKTAFGDTFTARKGEDGHRAFSFARIVGPFAGSEVADNTWYPSNGGRAESAKGVGLAFGMVFCRNLIREVVAR